MDELEARIARLEVDKFGVPAIEAAMRRLEAKFADEVATPQRNCDCAVDAKRMVMDLHRELDDTLRAHLGIPFEVRSIRRAERAGWRG